MRDTDMVIVTRCSTFDHPLPDTSDLDPTNLDRLAASLDYLERIPVMFVNRRSQRGSENSCILRD
jgi:hypothetical protein